MFSNDHFHYPDQILAELLRNKIRGELTHKSTNPTVFYRAVVVAIDVAGGNLENPTASGGVTHSVGGKDVKIPAIEGPLNPKNSIKARVISDGFDQFSTDDDLKIYYPAMPEHMTPPIKLGEHVYVFYEDEDYDNGLWFAKVAGQEGLNAAPGESFFVKDGADSLANLFDSSKSAAQPKTDLETDKAAGESYGSKNDLVSLFSNG